MMKTDLTPPLSINGLPIKALSSKVFTVTVLAIISFITPLTALSGVYKQVDEEGNVIYSDVPEKAGAKAIKPPPITTIKPLAPTTPASQEGRSPAKPSSSESKAKKSESTRSYSSLNITSPENEATIRANGGNFGISLSSEPALDSGHHYVVLVNGTKNQQGTGSTITVTGVSRGQQSISAQIEDEEGNVLARSGTVTVHVLRASKR